MKKDPIAYALGRDLLDLAHSSNANIPQICKAFGDCFMATTSLLYVKGEGRVTKEDCLKVVDALKRDLLLNLEKFEKKEKSNVRTEVPKR